MATTKPTQNDLNLLDNTSADANGWVKKDFGNFQLYEKSVTFSSITINGNTNTVLATINMPVGVTNSGSARFQCGYLGGFGGRIYANLDNGGTTSTVTSMTLQLGNSQASGITTSGVIYLQAITV